MQLSRFIKLKAQSINSFGLTGFLTLLSLFGACFYTNCQLPATARSAHGGGSTQRYSDGVTVRKNADGTVETFDSGSAPESINQDMGQAVRRPIVSRAYTRVIGGVHVRRNSDGTVETYEALSRPVSLYPMVKSTRSPRHSK